jgi:hypothetical protein
MMGWPWVYGQDYKIMMVYRSKNEEMPEIIIFPLFVFPVAQSSTG